METSKAIRQRFTLREGVRDERTRRLAAAAGALALGWGGIRAVAQATGGSRRAIPQGIQEVQQPEGAPPSGRIRKPGGGRKTTIRQDLERLIEPATTLVSAN